MAIENKALKKVVWANIIIWPIVLLIYLLPASVKPVIDPSKNQHQSQEITSYIKQNFGMPNFTASWYSEIEHIAINETGKQRVIEIFTTLDEPSSPVGNKLCNAVSNYWQNHKDSFTGIRVIGMGGQITNYRYSLNGQCS